MWKEAIVAYFNVIGLYYASYPVGTSALPLRVNWPAVQLTAILRPASRLRMRGSVLPVLLNAFMAWTGTNFPLRCCYMLNTSNITSTFGIVTVFVIVDL
jgi:hypothetical protein